MTDDPQGFAFTYTDHTQGIKTRWTLQPIRLDEATCEWYDDPNPERVAPILAAEAAELDKALPRKPRRPDGFGTEFFSLGMCSECGFDSHGASFLARIVCRDCWGKGTDIGTLYRLGVRRIAETWGPLPVSGGLWSDGTNAHAPKSSNNHRQQYLIYHLASEPCTIEGWCKKHGHLSGDLSLSRRRKNAVVALTPTRSGLHGPKKCEDHPLGVPTVPLS